MLNQQLRIPNASDLIEICVMYDTDKHVHTFSW